MSEVAVFGAGSVVFIITSWATIAFGMARVNQLHEEDQRQIEVDAGGDGS